MNEVTGAANLVAAKKKLSSKFFKKGITVAILSGMFYGLYSTFLMLGMSKGVWADWYGPNEAILSAFVITYMVGALGSAINDTISGIWCMGIAAFKGKLGTKAAPATNRATVSPIPPIRPAIRTSRLFMPSGSLN